MVGTVLQQGRYITHDCIYMMIFVLVEILLAGTSHGIMVDGTIEFCMRYILVTSSEDVVYSQTVTG